MHLYICTPSRGAIDHQFLTCREVLIELCRAKGHSVSRIDTYGASLLDQARSRIATDFWEATEDQPDAVLLWLDDDMVFDAEEVLRMAEECVHQEWIVGAVSMMKKPFGDPNICPLRDGPEQLHFFKDGKLEEIVSIGTGICAVGRRVFTKLVKIGAVPKCKQGTLGATIFPFYRTMIDDDMLWWGEDSSFCVLSRSVGCKVWADTRVRCFHKGCYLYGLEDAGSAVERVGTLHMTVRLPSP